MYKYAVARLICFMEETLIIIAEEQPPAASFSWLVSLI